MELKRDLLEELIVWKSKRKRKPLILQGARQVGKSWLLNSPCLSLDSLVFLQH